jgi:hypothetical protein
MGKDYVSEDDKWPPSRKGWPAGPWDNEPDRKEWRDAVTGYPCLILRNSLGGLCGYVGVGPGHPLHGVNYDNALDINVHGGLTYSDKCAGHICHTPDPVESDDVWWFGFDCGHYRDMLPGILAHYRRDARDQTYKDMAYVESEIASLAVQLGAKE